MEQLYSWCFILDFSKKKRHLRTQMTLILTFLNSKLLHNNPNKSSYSHINNCISIYGFKNVVVRFISTFETFVYTKRKVDNNVFCFVSCNGKRGLKLTCNQTTSWRNG